MVQSRIIDAETKNNSINPQSVFESNQKSVNSIILASVCRGRAIFASNEISNLQMIATQCPFTGGPSVFEARSLLLLTNSELVWEDDVLCSGSTARKASKDPKYFFARIYPNPASSNIFLQYDLTAYSEARLEIIDAEGRKLKSLNLDTKDYSIEVEINDLVNGIYFLKLFSENQIIKVEKFTVIK